jgi:hypothetical protein
MRRAADRTGTTVPSGRLFSIVCNFLDSIGNRNPSQASQLMQIAACFGQALARAIDYAGAVFQLRINDLSGPSYQDFLFDTVPYVN